MNVLIATLTYGLFGETDGVANTFQNLVQEFNRKKLNIDILSYGPKTELIQEGTVTIHSHKPIFPLKFDVMPYYSDPLFSFSKTAKYLMNTKYDIVHSATPDFLGLFIKKYSELHKVPYLTTYHTEAPLFAKLRVEKTFGDHAGKIAYKIMDKYYQWYFHKTDLLLVPNKAMIKPFEKRFRTKVNVLSRGVDNTKFNPRKRSRFEASKLRALFVGRIEPEKNLRILIDIFNKRPNIELTLVGSGSYFNTLKKSMPIARFTGKLKGEKLFTEYANADFFVMPSKSDPFGNVVLEAMASGLPVIVTDVGGPKEIVTDGVDGFIAKDDSEFEKYIDRLINDKNLLKAMGKNALATSRKYEWSNITEQLINYYQVLIND